MYFVTREIDRPVERSCNFCRRNLSAKHGMKSEFTAGPNEQITTQTYIGNWSTRFKMLAYAGIFFGILYFMAREMTGPPFAQGSYLIAELLVGISAALIGLIFGCYCLSCLADSFSVYSLDDNGIEKRGFGRSISLSWRTIVACRYNGRGNANLTLHDESGRCLKMDSDLVADPQGTLHTTLDARLQPIYDRQQQEFQLQGRTFHPLRGRALITVPILFMVAGAGMGVVCDPQKISSPMVEKIGMALFFTCIGLVIALIGSYAFTLKITVSGDAIALDSIFQHRQIPFARIEQLASYTASDGRGGAIRTTIIASTDQYITITDAMPDYISLRDYITSRTNPQAVVPSEI